MRHHRFGSDDLATPAASWLNEKFLTWEQQTKRRQTIRAFAAYLNVKETSLSGWLNGTATPTGENLIRLALKLGPEIYDIVGVERPDENMTHFTARISAMTPEERAETWMQINQLLDEMGAKKDS